LRRNKIIFGALILILLNAITTPISATSFSASVSPERIGPGDNVNIEVSTDPDCLGVIFVWKPIYIDGFLIEDWCDFLEVLSEYPEELIMCADIIIFDSNGIDASYPDTWIGLIDSEHILDPYTFDPCELNLEDLPLVVWNEEIEDWQMEIYDSNYGPNTNILGKYLIAIFAVDADWVESLINAICTENWDLVEDLICNPTWVGGFITSFYVIPEFTLGTVTGTVTSLLAFTALRILKRKRWC